MKWCKKFGYFFNLLLTISDAFTWKHCHKITSKRYNLASVHQLLAKLYKPTLSLKEEGLPLQSAHCYSLSANPIPKQNAVSSAKWRWCWQEPSAWCTHKGEVSPVLWRVSSNDIQTLRATNPTELSEYKILFGTCEWEQLPLVLRAV